MYTLTLSDLTEGTDHYSGHGHTTGSLNQLPNTVEVFLMKTLKLIVASLLLALVVASVAAAAPRSKTHRNHTATTCWKISCKGGLRPIEWVTA